MPRSLRPDSPVPNASLGRIAARLARGAWRIGAALRRTRPLTIVAMVAIAAVGVAIGWRLVQRPVPTSGAGSVVRVGVSEGDVIADYATASRIELAALNPTQSVYALVSLASYLTPGQVSTLLTGPGRPDPTHSPGSSPIADGRDDRVPVAIVAGYARVPVPRRQTELVRLAAQRVPEDLIMRMAQIGERKERDATRYATLAQAEQSPSLRAVYQSNAELAMVEARAYRAGCGCVFAVVVWGTVAGLLTLREQSAIRVVDAAPEILDLNRTVFTAPLPEQRDRVSPPPDDGMTTPSSSPI